MKIASYNVENFFLRAKAMNLPARADGADVLKMQAEMNRILSKKKYLRRRQAKDCRSHEKARYRKEG